VCEARSRDTYLSLFYRASAHVVILIWRPSYTRCAAQAAINPLCPSGPKGLGGDSHDLVAVGQSFEIVGNVEGWIVKMVAAVTCYEEMDPDSV